LIQRFSAVILSTGALAIETRVLPFKEAFFSSLVYEEHSHDLGIIISHDYLTGSTFGEKHGGIVVVMMH
jgi:hypothetical protein